MTDATITTLGKLRKRLWTLALVTFIGYYFADAAMDAWMFGEATFTEQLLSPNAHEVSIRLLHLFFQSLIVWIAWRLFVEGKRLESSLEQSNLQLQIANADLLAANKRLKSFNYSLSHDLQNPLTTILTACELMSDKDVNQEVNQEKLHSATLDSALKMQDLVDAMLMLAGLGTREMRFTQVDLSAQAEGIAAALERKDPVRKIRWEIEGGIILHADKRLVAVLLENLMNNAHKFTAGKELATISVGRRVGEPEVIEVRDNGVGFDEEKAEELFLPFSRLHDAEQFPGHGIGLATVQSIVERHHGRIWAESNPGQGSCFCFTLGPSGTT